MRTARVVVSSFLLALGLASVFVSAQVYKCVDTDGKITYSNDRGQDKGCKPLSGEQSVSTISMRVSPPPAAFPKISDEMQKDRDKARRQVLEKELENEELALEGARKELAEQEGVRYGNEKNYQKALDRMQPYKDTVERHERNIKALNQELSGLR